jgi:hypothetical protein
MSSDARAGRGCLAIPQRRRQKSLVWGRVMSAVANPSTRSCSFTQGAALPPKARVSLPLRLVLGAMAMVLLQSPALAHLSHLEAPAAEHDGNIDVTRLVSVGKAAVRLARVARPRQPDSGKNCKKVGEVL